MQPIRVRKLKARSHLTLFSPTLSEIDECIANEMVRQAKAVAKKAKKKPKPKKKVDLDIKDTLLSLTSDADDEDEEEEKVLLPASPITPRPEVRQEPEVEKEEEEEIHKEDPSAKIQLGLETASETEEEAEHEELVAPKFEKETAQKKPKVPGKKKKKKLKKGTSESELSDTSGESEVEDSRQADTRKVMKKKHKVKRVPQVTAAEEEEEEEAEAEEETQEKKKTVAPVIKKSKVKKIRKISQTVSVTKNEEKEEKEEESEDIEISQEEKDRKKKKAKRKLRPSSAVSDRSRADFITEDFEKAEVEHPGKVTRSKPSLVLLKSSLEALPRSDLEAPKDALEMSKPGLETPKHSLVELVAEKLEALTKVSKTSSEAEKVDVLTKVSKTSSLEKSSKSTLPPISSKTSVAVDEEGEKAYENPILASLLATAAGVEPGPNDADPAQFIRSDPCVSSSLMNYLLRKSQWVNKKKSDLEEIVEVLEDGTVDNEYAMNQLLALTTEEEQNTPEFTAAMSFISKTKDPTSIALMMKRIKYEGITEDLSKSLDRALKVANLRSQKAFDYKTPPIKEEEYIPSPVKDAPVIYPRSKSVEKIMDTGVADYIDKTVSAWATTLRKKMLSWRTSVKSTDAILLPKIQRDLKKTVKRFSTSGGKEEVTARALLRKKLPKFQGWETGFGLPFIGLRGLPTATEEALLELERMKEAHKRWNYFGEVESFMEDSQQTDQAEDAWRESFTRGSKDRHVPKDHQTYKEHFPAVEPIDDVEKYFATHRISEIFERLTTSLLIEMPENALDFLIERVRLMVNPARLEREMDIRQAKKTTNEPWPLPQTP